MSGWYSSNEALIQAALGLCLLGYSTQMALRAGVFSLAGVGFWAIGGYTVANLVTRGWSTPLAIAVAVAGSLVPALLMALILRRLRALYLAMATFAFVLIVQIIAVTWVSVTGGPVGFFGIPVTVSTFGLLMIVAACSLGLVFWERGRRGRAIEALREDEQLASTLGINVPRERVTVFVISAGLGTLSGCVNALMFNLLSPEEVGFGLITSVLTVIVLGGTGAWWGPLIGAFIVTWLPEWLRWAGDYRDVVQGAIIVLVVVYFPEGAVGLVRRLRRLVQRRGVRDARVEPAAARPLAAPVREGSE